MVCGGKPVGRIPACVRNRNIPLTKKDERPDEGVAPSVGLQNLRIRLGEQPQGIGAEAPEVFWIAMENLHQPSGIYSQSVGVSIPETTLGRRDPDDLPHAPILDR